MVNNLKTIFTVLYLSVKLAQHLVKLAKYIFIEKFGLGNFECKIDKNFYFTT